MARNVRPSFPGRRFTHVQRGWSRLTLTGSVSHVFGMSWKISFSSNKSLFVFKFFSTKTILMLKPRKSSICPTVSSDFNWPLTIWIICIMEMYKGLSGLVGRGGMGLLKWNANALGTKAADNPSCHERAFRFSYIILGLIIEREAPTSNRIMHEAISFNRKAHLVSSSTLSCY